MKHQINCKEYNKKVCTDPKQCECNYSIRKEEPLLKEKMWHRFIYKFGHIDFGKFESEKWETHDILDFIESELQFEREEIRKEIENIILVNAVMKFNSTPQVGETFNPEKHNHTNKMLNDISGYIHEAILSLLSDKSKE